MENEKIIKLLKEKKIKTTKNRIAILSCLMDTTHESHFHSVKQIIKHTKGLNTKSVYNSIKSLISAGIVDTHSFGGIAKYAINDHYNNTHNVIHIVDENSDIKHVDIDSGIIKKIKKGILKSGYAVKSVSMFAVVEKK